MRPILRSMFFTAEMLVAAVALAVAGLSVCAYAASSRVLRDYYRELPGGWPLVNTDAQ